MSHIPEVSDRDDTEPRIVVPPDAPWLGVARSYLGVVERMGDADHPLIVAWLKAVGLPEQHDETAWCSAFVNACMREAGIAGTGKANARSWLHWGVPIVTPRPGCVVVFSRPPLPAQGHVAFYVGESKETLTVLGGNQHNRVCVADYDRGRWLAYRWPHV